MVRTVTAIRNRLGECPVWSPEAQKLYWMDLLEPALYACEPGGRFARWPMPEYLGGLALRRKGGLVLGMQSRIAAFTPETGALEDLFVFRETGEAVRFNDGKCDCRGRFLIGNMKDPDIAADGELVANRKVGAGSVFVLEPDLTFRLLEDGYTIPNGFAWDADYSTLYLADSHENAVYAYDYDREAGTIARKRTFASAGQMPGVPDGACMDEEGCLWSARNGGGCLVRYRPDGTVDRTLTLPVSLPTSVAFGGRSMDTLFVTTASQGLSREAIAEQPLAGALLAVDAGVKGAAVAMFAG
ncbi:MAG: SMP-30/gluconolactonase/LRE family protein [Deltaproteobacteria bacterium]|nr:SMP-30/gluconolactonase/LRE family protein [Deltaproteobacteria bacterium]